MTVFFQLPISVTWWSKAAPAEIVVSNHVRDMDDVC